MTYPVKIYWKHSDEALNKWNEKCITLIEKFGLPGTQNYSTTVTTEYMQINFIKEKDAILAALIL